MTGIDGCLIRQSKTRGLTKNETKKIKNNFKKNIKNTAAIILNDFRPAWTWPTRP